MCNTINHTGIRNSIRLILLIIITLAISAGDAQGSVPGQHFPDSAIAQRRFIFQAQWVVAYTGNRRQLTPPYELLVTPDSVDCYLPFVGRMYTVPTLKELEFMSIRFVSKKFSYTVQKKGRSGWDVVIVPADVRKVQELSFSITQSGRATLTIRFTGRDPASYEGIIDTVRE